MDPEHNTTTDLMASNQLRREIDRLAAQAAALHALRRTHPSQEDTTR